MEKLCFICEKQKVGKSICDFSDEELGLKEMVDEIFKIKFNENKIFVKLKICKGCVQELTTCQTFYQRVKKAQERINAEIDVNSLVKIEIKQEPKDDDMIQLCYAQDFDFFQSFEANDDDDNSSSREDQLELNAKQKKSTKTSSRSFTNKETRTYNKLTPDERKQRGNRGMRRAKEAIKITTDYLYKKELKGNFIEPPEEMQIPVEDRNRNGTVSQRITAAFASTSWSTAYEWKCTETTCGKIFPNILDLNVHLHKAHRIKYRTTCSLCLKPTQHYAAFLNHIIDHHAPNNKFCCIICTQSTFFWNFKDLYNHYQKTHKIKNLMFCLYCGLQFHCGARLKEHLIHKHNRENDRAEEFFCDFCGFKTEQRSRIKSHMVRHVTPTHLCYLCSATFTDSGYLSTHLRQVHSELKIQCPKCEKVFKTHKRLRCHFQTVHEEDKPFLCEICNKRFAARHRLNIHLKIHRDQREESYQCAYCERRFKYKPGMLYHERAAHTGEQPYKCPIEGCYERFYDFSNAKKHINGRHNSSLRPILENM